MYFDKETQEDASHKIDDKNEHDIVILGENTKYAPIEWHFPRTNNCPKVYCNKYFESRHATMQHYCKVHAKNDLLCEECNSLISMTGQHNLINHFQRKHPHAPIPMPTSSVPESTNAPIRIVQIDELNEQTPQLNADQSILQPTATAKKIDRRRNQNASKTNSITFAGVSTNMFLLFIIRRSSFFYWSLI